MCSGGAVGENYRQLDSQSLLQAIHEDSGETAKYYATKYFGPKSLRKVETLLWSDLKKYGHVDVERDEDLQSPARWYPVQSYAQRAPIVRRYRAEDYDLSYLQHEDKFDVYRSDKMRESDLEARLRTQRGYEQSQQQGGRGWGGGGGMSWAAWGSHQQPQRYYKNMWQSNGRTTGRWGGTGASGSGGWSTTASAGSGSGWGSSSWSSTSASSGWSSSDKGNAWNNSGNSSSTSQWSGGSSSGGWAQSPGSQSWAQSPGSQSGWELSSEPSASGRWGQHQTAPESTGWSQAQAGGWAPEQPGGTSGGQ